MKKRLFYSALVVLTAAMSSLCATELLGAVGDGGLRLPGLILKDDNGKTVGEVVMLTPMSWLSTVSFIESEPGSVIAVMRDEGFPVFVETSGFRAEAGSLRIGRSIFFQLNDCEGLAYFSGNDGSLLLQRDYAIDHPQILYREVEGFLNNVQTSSRFTGHCSNNPANISTARAAEVVVDLTTVFTPPYHVE